MVTDTFSRRALCVALTLLIASTAAIAGEVQLSWDPSAGADGYRVHRGTAAGQYSDSTDVGNTTSASADGLTDCMIWYFGVTAYNSVGESGYSNEKSSWPRAVLASANPAVAEQGTQLDVFVSGTNFRDGDTISVSNPGVQINAVTVNTCNGMTLTLTVASDAPTGPADISVTHPSGVVGTGSGLLTIAAAVTPTVLATSPLDGATDVSLTVQPTVEFSEAVTGATSANVRLLDDQDIPVPQAAGSPVMSAGDTIATIVPAADLAHGSAYRIQVLGGASGVHDLDGHPMASDFLQPTGFTTVPDSAAPTISDVQATTVDDTSAVITWTTDEPADSEVFYRKQGHTTYQTVAITDDVTDHAVDLTGLEPETTYEFHVSSTDAAGNTATSSPDDTFTTTTGLYTYIRFEAEAGVIVDPVQVTAGGAAFNGEWIDTPAGAGQGSTNAPLGTATHGVYIPETGTWFLWVRMYAIDGSANTWFESIDGASRATITTNDFGQWSWVEGRSYDLAEGLHSVELGGREAETRADRVLLTNDPDFVPTEQPDVDVIPPGAVADLAATPVNDWIDLTWANPTDADLATVVIRYRTDGQYPTSPADGLALVDQPAVPDAIEVYSHTGVVPGTTYHYSAFAIDGVGNVSLAAHVLGAVGSVPPPPQNVTVY